MNKVQHTHSALTLLEDGLLQLFCDQAHQRPQSTYGWAARQDKQDIMIIAQPKSGLSMPEANICV
ncbi:hypothetical protein D3C73_1117960 [compost metagenome]